MKWVAVLKTILFATALGSLIGCQSVVNEEGGQGAPAGETADLESPEAASKDIVEPETAVGPDEGAGIESEDRSYWESVVELSERVRSSGESTAVDTKEWVAEDIRKIGIWEYRTLVVPLDEGTDMEAELNKLGAKRWECFWVDKRATSITFYLKKSGRSYMRALPLRDLLRLAPLFGGDGDGSQ